MNIPQASGQPDLEGKGIQEEGGKIESFCFMSKIVCDSNSVAVLSSEAFECLPLVFAVTSEKGMI